MKQLVFFPHWWPSSYFLQNRFFIIYMFITNGYPQNHLRFCGNFFPWNLLILQTICIIFFINKAANSNLHFYTINFPLCQRYKIFSSLTFELWMEIIQNLFYSIYLVLPFSPRYHHKQHDAHEARNEYQPKDRSQHRR